MRDLYEKFLDGAVPAAEWCARQIYWRLPFLQQVSANKRRKKHTKPIDKFLTESQLRDALNLVGFAQRSPITMVHSSTTHWQLKKDENSEPMSPLKTSVRTLEILMEINEEHGGTLVMPATPVFKTPYSPFVSIKGNKEVYDPLRTPTKRGLINEFFRQQPGVKRSLHPLSTVACVGPLADRLLEGNLGGEKPFAHGLTSAYYRIYKENGMIMSLGTSLDHYMTIGHVAEDICPNVFPDSFYRDFPFMLVTENGFEDRTVKQRHPAANRCMSERALVRFLRRKGLLHKVAYDNVPFDWAMAGPLIDALLEFRNQRKTFPYFFLSLMTPCR